MAENDGRGDPPRDEAIESLALTPAARAAAYELKRLHPGVVFTSGRRDTAAQAKAMASNVVRNRKWIVQTYKESEVRTACQKWVDEHLAAAPRDKMQARLISVF